MITQTEVNSRNEKFWKQTSSDKSCLRTIKYFWIVFQALFSDFRKLK